LGNNLYGTTEYGELGYSTVFTGHGTIFSISLNVVSLPIPVVTDFHLLGKNIVINAVGQSAGNYKTLASTNPLLAASRQVSFLQDKLKKPELFCRAGHFLGKRQRRT
jgi:hypothetical protein